MPRDITPYIVEGGDRKAPSPSSIILLSRRKPGPLEQVQCFPFVGDLSNPKSKAKSSRRVLCFDFCHFVEILDSKK